MITYARFRKILLGDMTLSEIYFFVTDYSIDNARIRELFNLTDDDYKSLIEYQKRAENAQISYCEDHEREYFDFEK
jgi:hypothetical protein